MTTTLREEITKLFWEVRNGRSLDWQHDYYYADEVISNIKKRIDELIQVDTETLQRDLGTKEGKIAAQTSKNTLILVKEMLKQ